MDKKNILITAYAFSPMAYSKYPAEEDTFGWKLVEQISSEYDIWVLTHSSNREEVLEALSRGEMPGVNIHFLELSAFLGKLCRVKCWKNLYVYLWQRAARKKALELHQEIGFDLVHHLTLGKGWLAGFVGADLPVRFVWGPLGSRQRIPKMFSGELNFFLRFYESIRRMVQGMERHLIYRKKCVRKAKMILLSSQETRDEILKKYRKKIRHFPAHGIDKANIRVKPVKARKQKKFRVISVGRIERNMGFELAVAAFNRFAAGDPNAEMTIVGEGSERERIESLIIELGLAGKITIQTKMEREELLSRMKRSDVFLYSGFQDEGAAVVVEAMACGLPIVCLNTGESGFNVKEKWGIKIQPTSRNYVIDETAKALSRLNKNEKLRAEMGEAARKRAREYYEWTRLGKRMMEIYEQIFF